ncbi:hypothetical protein J5X98_02155 [Leptothermofonsia sichuanensis E412]|uniref:hypothetical protein n=1 Tax=Leptothermofonsia sichuanensis TaxID=2917832 RepID=UPI001CA62E00|nr:hypothetical protein [Leptothermofonsia sichuanensis]QZZ21309.1 hypothetical protein J5X98_02155 [Leptothermofonsia sichuanensis E412]
MAETLDLFLDLFIDLNEAGLDLEPEELEAYCQRLVADLKDGLAEEASLARSSDVPEGSKAGEAGFDLGILKAEVNVKNLLALLGWLRNRIAGATLSIEYGDVKLEYRTPEQLEQQLQALEKISHLTVRVVKSETSKG